MLTLQTILVPTDFFRLVSRRPCRGGFPGVPERRAAQAASDSPARRG